MARVAVITEFNPPHKGHEYLATRIRETFGSDTEIVAIMSGNYVQRGDVAIVDKYTRAKMALSMGYNLILELPFPYSVSSARDFADAGVCIADKLGCIDYLFFGSECGDLAYLSQIARCISTPDFEKTILTMREKKEGEILSYIQLATQSIATLMGDEAIHVFVQPNNILAISYLASLQKRNSVIQPYTIARVGDFHSRELSNNTLPSASAIREKLYAGRLSDVAPYVNSQIYEELCTAYENGVLPANISNIYPNIVQNLKSFSASNFFPTAEADTSLLHRLFRNIDEATSFSHLVELTKAKHYTDAHVRRAILLAYFKITYAWLHGEPEYTCLLACDTVGRKLLKYSKKTRRIHVLTKVADYHELPYFFARAQAQYTTHSDMLYLRSLPKPQPVANALRISPYIIK